MSATPRNPTDWGTIATVVLAVAAILTLQTAKLNRMEDRLKRDQEAMEVRLKTAIDEAKDEVTMLQVETRAIREALIANQVMIPRIVPEPPIQVDMNNPNPDEPES